jgi:vacuolar-type H+-ATPase subunit I/STV1
MENKVLATDIKKDIYTYTESVSRMFELIRHEAEYMRKADSGANGQFANTINALEAAEADLGKIVVVADKINEQIKLLNANTEELRKLAEYGKKALQDAEAVVMTVQRSSQADKEKLWKSMEDYIAENNLIH